MPDLTAEEIAELRRLDYSAPKWRDDDPTTRPIVIHPGFYDGEPEEHQLAAAMRRGLLPLLDEVERRRKRDEITFRALENIAPDAKRAIENALRERGLL